MAERPRRARGAGPDPRRRIFVVMAAFVLVGAVFVIQLVDLQTVGSDRYRNLGEDQRFRTQSLAGYRGDIVDRGGFVLAASTPGQELIADPSVITDPAATAAVFGPALGVEPTSLLDQLTASSDTDRYGLLAATMDEQALLRVLAVLDDPAHDDRTAGVVLRPVEERVYPAGTLARPIVGGVDTDEIGHSGTEWQFDEILDGQPGRVKSEQGLFGSIVNGEYELDPATQGHDVMLTIDHRIQYVVEEALISHCQEMRARSANSVVTDPRTGEILAMATVVRADDGTCYVPRHNASLVETFAPGSVLKLVTVAAAVEEFGYTGATPIAVPPQIEIDGHVFEDHPPHPAADFPISQIVASSMNVGAIRLAQQLGNAQLYSYFQSFGFGQDSGLGFKDEAVGQVPEVWYGSEFGSIPIGYGINVNSMQVLSAYNSIANDGLFVAPKLVRGLIGPDGTQRPAEPQQSRRVVSDRTANELTAMLTQVVEAENGTGGAAAVPGYTVAGKTGTAWKVFTDGPHAGTYGVEGERKYVVTFAGFLPADSPELSIIVVVDEPETETSAGKVAAPVFADIAHYALRILGIPPQAVAPEGTTAVRGTPAGVTEDEQWAVDHPEQATLVTGGG